MTSGAGRRWTLRIDHFIVGDISEVIGFSERFEEHPRMERYVLIANLGDGRVVEVPPAWRSDEAGLFVDCTVEPPAARKAAQDLAEDLKLDLAERDLDGDLATVSGFEALPQKVQLCLWHQRGQLQWAPDLGTRMAEYYGLFGGSPWLEQLVKLEVIRMAAIPYQDSLPEREYTPFECVTRVKTVELLAVEAVDEHVPVRLTLDVLGVGEWTRDVTLFVPAFPFAPPPSPPSAADLI